MWYNKTIVALVWGYYDDLFTLDSECYPRAWLPASGEQIEGWAQDWSNSNIFLKPLFRGNFDLFVNNANLGSIAHTSNGT